MGQFDPFPEAIFRPEVWKHAASVPRVAGISEMHQDLDLNPLWFKRAPMTRIPKTCETIVLIRTRPPAVLSLCREARSLGLTISKAMDTRITIKGGAFDVPVYVNPQVDYTHQGKQTCRKGDAFRIRHKLEGTKTHLLPQHGI